MTLALAAFSAIFTSFDEIHYTIDLSSWNSSNNAVIGHSVSNLSKIGFPFKRLMIDNEAWKA